MNPQDPLFYSAIVVVAALYSAVGHGGASGYLALMAFTPLLPKEAAVIALVMNVFVASISFASYERAKHFDWKLAWPFLVGSVPMAFLGGGLHLPPKAYAVILALALTAAAVRLQMNIRADEGRDPVPMKVWVGVAIGAVIGFVSGLVGLGGGVFLSPVIILCFWADAKRTSAVSAIFIVANSLAGLLARPFDSLSVVAQYWPMVVCGIAGAVIGSYLGAFKAPNPALRRTLGVVLAIAVIKLCTKAVGL